MKITRNLQATKQQAERKPMLIQVVKSRGNFGHAGRPGQVGGSAPSGGGSYPKSELVQGAALKESAAATNGRLAADVTDSELVQTRVIANPANRNAGAFSSFFHVLKNNNPAQAADSLHEYLTSEAAGNVRRVGQPETTGRTGWKIRAETNDGDVHHFRFIKSQKSYSKEELDDDGCDASFLNITVKRFTAQEELAPDAVISKRDVKDASGEVVDYRDVRIRGYLTTWQETTPKDREGEYVVKGAFTKGLGAFMQNPVMLRDHKNSTDSVAGSFKVMKEDGRGLYFEALLSNSDQMKSVRRDIVDGHLKTTSMGGAFVYDRDKKGIREVALYEGTLTPIPMNPDARFEVLDASPIEKKFIEDGGTLAGMKSVGKIESFRQSLNTQLKA